MFAVEDNGPSITEARWPQIFDRFFRHSPAVGEGCGLGLAIVREIAMAHGASVELESGREGRGARFFGFLRGLTPFIPLRKTSARSSLPLPSQPPMRGRYR